MSAPSPTTEQAPPTRGRPGWVLPAVAVSAVAVVGLLLYLFQPWALFTTTVVDEALPEAVVTSPAVPATPGASPSAGASQPAASPSVPAGPVRLASGDFRSYEHDTSGTATLLSVGDRTVVRLTDFATSNGPDVKVWLSKAKAGDATSAKTAGYVDLGELKGNKGNQNYQVPAGIDATAYASVVVWCDRFSVPFGAAGLAKA